MPERCVKADLGGVDLHLVERIDGDEDVANVGVDLVPAVATLELLRHLVLEESTKKRRAKPAMFAPMVG